MMTVSFYKCFLVLIFGIILKFVYNNNQSVTEWSLIGQQQHPTNMSIYQSTSCESVTLLRCGMLICPVIWPQHIHFVSVCLCVSISSNEFLVKQNWSSNFVFMQLACLPRRTHEGEFLHHAIVYHCFGSRALSFKRPLLSLNVGVCVRNFEVKYLGVSYYGEPIGKWSGAFKW